MRAPKNLIDRLPNELLAMIKADYDEYDIQAHVHYYQVSPRTAAFYDDGDEFWQQLCFMNALGYVHDDEENSASWKDIAFEVVKHADNCWFRYCGTEQLEYNCGYLLS